jgi:acyl-CoA synthetase (AMP-forming)/AMP-acid ligase II
MPTETKLPVGGSALSAADLAMDGPVVTEDWLGAPARSYPRRPRTILEVLDRAVRRWPDEVAFVDEQGGRATYAQFSALVIAAAARLRGYGVSPGDRVVVAGRNRLDMAVAVFACASAGAIMAGLNIRLAVSEWEYMIRRSRARLALAQPELLADLSSAAASAGLTQGQVVPLGTLTADIPARNGGPGPLAVAVPATAEDRTFQVVWTSGSTGRPKASQVVHRCSVHSGMSYQKVLGLRPGETTAVLFPLYYISALHAHVLPAMLAGGGCLLVETGDQGRWLELLAAHRVAWAYAVPSWWALAARDPRLSRRTLPALRLAAAGGAPFPASLVAELGERLPGTCLIDIYGLSETHSPATMAVGADLTDHPGSVGRPLPCMEVGLYSEDGARLPPGEPGEVRLRGSLVTTGYLDDPEATARAVRDGWFRTGDVGRLDADGYLYILDRTKDMINRGGQKVFSAEVERVIRELPGIADAAVVSRPDRLAGEAIVAMVVKEPGADVTELAVRQWVRGRLADFATPGHVRFADALPRNSTGKTDKAAVRRALADES